jgi:hypothetical protein
MKKGFISTNLFLMFVILITGFIISTVDIVKATLNNTATMNFENLNFDPIAANDTALVNDTSHFTAEVFVHKNFTGNSTLINENTPNLGGQFQDSISSLIITTDTNQSDGYMVEVCEHESYAGNCMILGPGRHNVETLGWLNDQITSIRALSPPTLELKNISPGVLTNGSN